MGGAIVSAAVSTIGSSLFLLCCTITIFIKLGLVIIAVTTLSIFFTLIALPAVMILFGPSRNPCYKRIPKQCIARVLGHPSTAGSTGKSFPATPKKGALWDVEPEEELLVCGEVLEVLS